VEHVRDRYGFQNTTKNREKRKDWRERERERRRNSSLLSIQHSPKELKKKKKKSKKKKKRVFKQGKSLIETSPGERLITLWASQIFVCFFFLGHQPCKSVRY